MFGLIHGLWKMATAKPEFAVCIVGLDGAGKTVCCSFSLTRPFDCEGEFFGHKKVMGVCATDTAGASQSHLHKQTCTACIHDPSHCRFEQFVLTLLFFSHSAFLSHPHSKTLLNSWEIGDVSVQACAMGLGRTSLSPNCLSFSPPLHTFMRTKQDDKLTAHTNTDLAQILQ